MEDKIKYTTIGSSGTDEVITDPRIPKDPRHPVEVRKVGTVVVALGGVFLESEGKWYELPKECRHMVGTQAEFIVRQIPASPSAAH